MSGLMKKTIEGKDRELASKLKEAETLHKEITAARKKM